jgi:hypothetical protein
MRACLLCVVYVFMCVYHVCLYVCVSCVYACMSVFMCVYHVCMRTCLFADSAAPLCRACAYARMCSHGYVHAQAHLSCRFCGCTHTAPLRLDERATTSCWRQVVLRRKAAALGRRFCRATLSSRNANVLPCNAVCTSSSGLRAAADSDEEGAGGRGLLSLLVC